jgi:hypothetical protein
VTWMCSVASVPAFIPINEKISLSLNCLSTWELNATAGVGSYEPWPEPIRICLQSHSRYIEKRGGILVNILRTSLQSRHKEQRSKNPGKPISVSVRHQIPDQGNSGQSRIPRLNLTIPSKTAQLSPSLDLPKISSFFGTRLRSVDTNYAGHPAMTIPPENDRGFRKDAQNRINLG